MNYSELKQEILEELNNVKSVKNADDLLAVTAWALSKATRLCKEIDLQNESELNGFESQSNEQL